MFLELLTVFLLHELVILVFLELGAGEIGLRISHLVGLQGLLLLEADLLLRPRLTELGLIRAWVILVLLFVALSLAAGRDIVLVAKLGGLRYRDSLVVSFLRKPRISILAAAFKMVLSRNILVEFVWADIAYAPLHF